jgi:cell division septation protein DedD
MNAPRLHRLVPATLLAVVVLAGPAQAQSRRAGISLLGGASVHSDLTPGLESAATLEPGWILGLQGEVWIAGGRTGVRVNGHYTQRQLDDGTGEFTVMGGDLDVLLRILPVLPARTAAPYLVLGGGLTRYDAIEGSPTLGNGLYGDNPVTRPHALAGAGVDILPASIAGLRVELADKVVFPSAGESPPTDGLPLVHNFIFTAGVQLRLGQLGNAVTFARDEPAREPAVAAEPPLEPEPRAARAEPELPPRREPEPEPEPEPRPAPAPRRAAPAGEPLGRPAPDPAQAPAPARAAGETAAYTVQVGSFMEPATAARWAERLESRGVPVWLLNIDIQGRRVSRVRAGAFTSEAAARELATALDRDYGWPARVDPIGNDEQVPAGAVEATRRFLRGR